MAESRDPLQIEEDQVFQKEQDVVELEAELHMQEQGVIEMERVYQRRAKAVITLLSYVAEQEDGLRSRAESLGPRAVVQIGEGGALPEQPMTPQQHAVPANPR